MSKEIWKDVLGYEGYYKASNLGRIKSLDRFAKNKLGIRNHFRKGRILSLGGDRYSVVTLIVDGAVKYMSAHRVIFEAFNGKTYLQIDHINNDIRDNRLCNLQALSSHDNNIKAKGRKFKTSKYPGVSIYTRGNYVRWKAQIGINNVKIALGYFVSEEDARDAYLKAKP